MARAGTQSAGGTGGGASGSDGSAFQGGEADDRLGSGGGGGGYYGGGGGAGGGGGSSYYSTAFVVNGQTFSGVGVASGGSFSADYRAGVGVGYSGAPDDAVRFGAGGNGLIVIRTVTPAASAVPEPSEYAAMGMLGATLLVGMVKARRKSATLSA